MTERLRRPNGGYVSTSEPAGEEDTRTEAEYAQEILQRVRARQAACRTIQDHVHRYFVAVYGKDYVYRAPETFENVLERWMFGVSVGLSAPGGFDTSYAEDQMKAIEAFWEDREKMQ